MKIQVFWSLDFGSVIVPVKEDSRDFLFNRIRREGGRPPTVVRNCKETNICVVRLGIELERKWKKTQRHRREEEGSCGLQNVLVGFRSYPS